jgi:protein O-GlcNAc transferase
MSADGIGMQTGMAASAKTDESFARATQEHRCGHLRKAAKLYADVLRHAPRHTQALHMLGMVQIQSGELNGGIDLVRRSLALAEGQPAAWCTLGNALRLQRQPVPALECFERAIALDPRHAPAHNNRGNVLIDLLRADEALVSYQRALELSPRHLGTLINCGNILVGLRRVPEALQHYARAIELSPTLATAWCAQGHALLCLQQPLEALASYERARSLGMEDFELLVGRSKALFALRRFDATLAGLDLAARLCADSHELHHLRASALFELWRLDEAIGACDRAIAIDASVAATHFNRGLALIHLGRYEQAAASYARALQVEPQFPGALGSLLQARLMCCDWTDWSSHAEQMAAELRSSPLPSIPYAVLSFADTAATQLRCARVFVHNKHTLLASSAAPAVPAIAARPKGQPLRVAFLSADFRDHPVAHLLAGVLEHLDRRRIGAIAVNLLPTDGSAIGRRIRAACADTIDISALNDHEAAQLLRNRGIDIAVDLQGYSFGHRDGLYARRIAPIQINYLGYAGTMGADFMDYIVADRALIPPGAESDYAEQVLRLPYSFMPFDDTQQVAATAPSRAAAGLPAEGFVYCAFNNHAKITPPIFELWMRLLIRSPGSCLWLRSFAASGMDNLRREAVSRGVAAERLVFAPKVAATAEHLARHRIADLFLDTLPYNAHATAASALWAGLPVLTCAGGTFAGRVSTSLLTALELPELIAADLADYESRALDLVAHPQRLAAIRERLQNARYGPAWDTARYSRDFSAALEQVWARHQAGERPGPIDIVAAATVERSP